MAFQFYLVVIELIWEVWLQKMNKSFSNIIAYLGTQGIAVTFVAQGEEDRLFRKMEEKIGNKIDSLPGIDNLMQGLNIFSALSDCGCSL